MSRLLGCDFSSSPSKRKAIVLAWGQWRQDRVCLNELVHCDSLDSFSQALHAPGPWVGGFDLPFGLPRELVSQLGWPTDWLACMQHYAGLSREQIRDAFAGFCNARPVGGKFAHRATDIPAGSSPSMKWVNPPVAFMLHAGVPMSAMVAGIAMGLISDGSRSVVLSDILGDEDHLGDMDFKVIGTEQGVTAIQLDNKLGGLTLELLAAVRSL
jgi:hypothetical protein